MEYVRFLSRELIPLTGKRPAKLHDPDLATLAAAGFGLWNPNAGALMLLPLGLGAADDVCRSFLQGLERTGLQPFPVQSLSERGPLEFAVRLLKRPGDLPRLFAERTNDRLTLQGFAEDAGSAADMASCALRALGQTLAAWGINVRRVERLTDDGFAVDLGVPADAGEEDGLISPTGSLYAPDSPLAAEPWQEASEEAQDLATPNCSTIDELAAFLSISPKRTVKSMCYTVGGKLAVVICRGDRQIDASKLKAAFGGAPFAPASDVELRAALGETAGYIGPAGLPDAVRLLADFSACECRNVVIGANRKGYHRTGAEWGRDFKTDWTADVTSVQIGDETPDGPLSACRWRRLVRVRPIDPAAAGEPSLVTSSAQGKRRIFPWLADVRLTSVLASAAACGKLARFVPFDLVLVSDDDVARTQFVSVLTEQNVRILEDDRPSPLTARAASCSPLGLPILTVSGGEAELTFPDGTRRPIGLTEISDLADLLANSRNQFSSL